MCRNITLLFNFEPPATDDEIHACALQYVRKVSGMNKPSAANEAAFDDAVARIEEATRDLVHGLKAKTPAKSRDELAEAAKERGRKREEQLKRRYGPAEAG
jgi:hypothetical protein